MRDIAPMMFGSVSPEEALGAVAVHSIREGGLVLKKGTVIGPRKCPALRAEGIARIVVARASEGDVGEDEAAAALAAALAGQGLRVDEAFTGRANLYADRGWRAVHRTRHGRSAECDR